MNPNNPYYPPGGNLPNPVPQMPIQGNNNMHSNGSKPKGLLITVVFLVIFLISAIGFGVWAYTERQDYKNRSDQKVAAAVTEAKKLTQDEDNKRFAEEIKNPLKLYTGPASYGSVKIWYPKTWSAYANNVNGSITPVDLYFHPDFVPSITSGGSSNTKPAIALRVQVLNQAYDQVLVSRQSFVKSGKASASPYALPKMPDQVGMKITGQLSEKLNGVEIILPLRDKTIVITTETDQFMADFNTHIIPNLTFVP